MTHKHIQHIYGMLFFVISEFLTKKNKKKTIKKNKEIEWHGKWKSLRKLMMISFADDDGNK